MGAHPETLRVLAEEARGLALRELGQATLYSVLVDLGEGAWSQRPHHLRFGFQELKRSLLFGTRLKACWVEFRPEPRSLRIVSTGTYGRRQFTELAAIQGIEFPPPALDLTRLQLEIPEVAAMLQRTCPFGGGMATLSLGVCVHEGHLAWRALQEVSAVGFRTLLVDAGDGHVLHERVDWWGESPGEGSPVLGGNRGEGGRRERS
jgi:hypothetical protein